MEEYTKPEWSHSALLTIDVQRDFTLPDAVFCIPGTFEVVPAMQSLARAYRAAELPIVHIVRLYLADGSNADMCRRQQIERGGRMAVPGTEGAHIVQELLPDRSVPLETASLLQGKPQRIGDREWVIYKPRWGAFYETSLADHLRQQGVNTLVFCGCNFPNCPRTSIYEASERDFRIVVAKDAISGIYDRGIDELKRIGVNVLTTDECIAELKSCDQACA